MNILTFDIEDWYHILHDYPEDILSKWASYEDRLNIGMDKIFKLLSDNNLKATFFVLGYIARKHPNIIKKIHNQGHEIGAHSDMHNVAYRQNEKEFEEDLVSCKKSIEDIIGEKVISYRAPGFSIRKENVWVFEILNKLKIEYDASIFPALREDGGFVSFNQSGPAIIDYKGCKIKEFPMSMNNLFGARFTATGGGYFRFFPYRMIYHFVKKSNYTMTYFHPRDFDPDQPILEGISIKRRFKSYYNLSGAFLKLQKLIRDFNFIDIRTASSQIDWDKVPLVNIDNQGNCF